MGRRISVNWNSLILTVGFSVFGFIGNELYSEVRKTHDAVIHFQDMMVTRDEFNVKITDLQVRMATIELEIEKIKEHQKL